MDNIPTIRTGNNCHLHLIGKTFTQSFIPLLLSPHLTIPIDIPYIIPNTETNKQNEETTIQTNAKNIHFNTRAWPLEYTCLSLKDLTQFMGGTTEKEEYHKMLEAGGGNNIILDPPSAENNPVQARNLPPTTNTRPSDPQTKIHK